MHHQIDQFDGSVIDFFCPESLLSNAADQLPTLPKSQCAYTVRDRYAVLGSIYYCFSYFFLLRLYILVSYRSKSFLCSSLILKVNLHLVRRLCILKRPISGFLFLLEDHSTSFFTLTPCCINSTTFEEYIFLFFF